MDLHTHDSDFSVSTNNKLTVLFLCFSAIFHFMQGLSADVIYIWFFRTLTVISVMLVIVLNLIKLIEWYKSKNK